MPRKGTGSDGTGLSEPLIGPGEKLSLSDNSLGPSNVASVPWDFQSLFSARCGGTGTPVIPASGEAEAGGSQVQGLLRLERSLLLLQGWEKGDSERAGGWPEVTQQV